MNRSFTPAGDKSIAHRAIIIAALARGVVRIHNVPLNNDCLTTARVMRKLGARVLLTGRKAATATMVVCGRGAQGLRVPQGALQAGESGTTLRLLLGVLAGQAFCSRVQAQGGLCNRPMRRVTEPLRRMGALVSARVKGGEEYPPLVLKGGNLRGISYTPEVASAQVKSAILLAGLFAQGLTEVREKKPTRDHTERMLREFGVAVRTHNGTVSLRGPCAPLRAPRSVYVPGDISSAAFFMVGALITPGARVSIRAVSLNPRRIAAVSVLRRMGGHIQLTPQLTTAGAEPVGTIVCSASDLRATRVFAHEVPSLIDEIPVLMVAASVAKGATVFCGVQELMVKETDRIRSMATNLRAMGVRVKVSRQGARVDVTVWGARTLKGGRMKSFGDHRTAMSALIAGLRTASPVTLDTTACIAKSFPDFERALARIFPKRK